MYSVGPGSESRDMVVLLAFFSLIQKFLHFTTIDGSSFKEDSWHDLLPFVQFEKRVKHPWRKVNFNKVAGFSLQLY